MVGFCVAAPRCPFTMKVMEPLGSVSWCRGAVVQLCFIPVPSWLESRAKAQRWKRTFRKVFVFLVSFVDETNLIFRIYIFAGNQQFVHCISAVSFMQANG